MLKYLLMEVVIQWVRTSWTKRSRGEPGAARRNAAPAAFPLPPVPPPFVHQVLMGEHDGFQPHFTLHEGLPGTGPDAGVLLTEDNGLLLVQLMVTPFGWPRRWRRPPAVRIAPGDWLRWQVNYRFGPETDGGEWTYRLDTLNVAHGPAPVNLFLGPPSRRVSELATLR
jgi:hypothetical protein